MWWLLNGIHKSYVFFLLIYDLSNYTHKASVPQILMMSR